MTRITVQGIDFELKFNIALDMLLNKQIKTEHDDKLGNELSGGLQKVLPPLLEMDENTLAKIYKIAMDADPDVKAALKAANIKLTEEDIAIAIGERMDSDVDGEQIFKEVFEEIERSNFCKKQLNKFAEQLGLISVIKSDKLDEEQVVLMVARLNSNYQKIKGEDLIPTNETEKA